MDRTGRAARNLVRAAGRHLAESGVLVGALVERLDDGGVRIELWELDGDGGGLRVRREELRDGAVCVDLVCELLRAGYLDGAEELRRRAVELLGVEVLP